MVHVSSSLLQVNLFTWIKCSTINDIMLEVEVEDTVSLVEYFFVEDLGC